MGERNSGQASHESLAMRRQQKTPRSTQEPLIIGPTKKIPEKFAPAERESYLQFVVWKLRRLLTVNNRENYDF